MFILHYSDVSHVFYCYLYFNMYIDSYIISLRRYLQ
nr:MAG TPA: hypothetical protein [Caudoviricetes sp.]